MEPPKPLPPKKNKDYAYKMGLDYVINGVNLVNCHFSIFSSAENAKAWEDGYREGKKEIVKNEL